VIKYKLFAIKTSARRTTMESITSEKLTIKQNQEVKNYLESLRGMRIDD
tara:strand:- start:973 stop:1119 length:147 start_codon:yes stop_codon:yes gene_type:complete